MEQQDQKQGKRDEGTVLGVESVGGPLGRRSHFARANDKEHQDTLQAQMEAKGCVCKQIKVTPRTLFNSKKGTRRKARG